MNTLGQPQKVAASPQAAAPSANASDSSQLTGVLDNVTSQLKQQNAPQEDIDKAHNAIYQYWGNYQQQKALRSSTGLNSIGADTSANALQSGLQDANQYAASSQAKNGVWQPINPNGDPISEPVKLIPNAISDVWGLTKGIFSLANPGNWSGILDSIVRNPASLAGPALEQAFYGMTNALGDAVSGNFNKAGSDLSEGVKKSLLAFGNHPITSFLGPMLAMEGIDAIAHPIDTATTIAKAGTAINFAKDAVTDPIGTGGALAAKVGGPFRGAMAKYTKSGADAALQSGIDQSLASMSGLQAINEQLMSRPDWMSMRDDLLAKASEIKANTGMPVGNLSSLLKTVGIDTEANSEFAGLVNKYDILNKSIPDGVTAIHNYMNAVANTTLDEANQAGGAEGLHGSLVQKGKVMDSTSDLLYDSALKDETGKPIPATPANTLGAVKSFIDDPRVSGGIDTETLTGLKRLHDQLVIRQALTETNGNLLEAGKVIQDKYDGLETPDFYVQKEGFNLGKYTPLDPAKIDSSLYRPLDAVGLKQTADGILEEARGTALDSKKAMSAYQEIMKPAVNADIESAVGQTNPGGLNLYKNAQAKYAQSQASAELFGLKDGSKSDVVAGKVFANWDEFKKTNPKLVPQAQAAKMAEILDGALEPDGKGGTAISFKKIQDGINENAHILSPEQLNELTGYISGNRFAGQLSDAHGAITDEINAQVSAIKEDAAQMKERAAMSPSDTTDWEMKARGIKSLQDLDNLSATSGLKPEEIGQIAARSILREIAAKFGGKTGVMAEDVTSIRGELTKIGGGSESADVIKQMFPDGPNGEINPVRTMFDNLQELLDNYKAAKNKTIIGRAINVAAGGMLMGMGHTFMGFGFMRRGLGVGVSEGLPGGGTAFEDIPGHTATVPGASQGEGILSSSFKGLKIIAPTASKAGAVISIAQMDKGNQK